MTITIACDISGVELDKLSKIDSSVVHLHAPLFLRSNLQSISDSRLCICNDLRVPLRALRENSAMFNLERVIFLSDNQEERQELETDAIESAGVAVIKLNVSSLSLSQEILGEIENEIVSQRLDDAELKSFYSSGKFGNDNTVIMVGAGIVNLITTLELAELGYQVKVFEKSADPRLSSKRSEQGCTFGGNDARMFTINEARNHCLKFTEQNKLVPYFRNSIKDNGWISTDNIDADNFQWLENANDTSQLLMGVYDRDIIGFNRESASLWNSIIHSHPDLFENVTHTDGILRVYQKTSQLSSALLKESSIGSIVKELSLDSLAMQQPALVKAIESNEVAGAIEVEGFSLGVQRFGMKLIDKLERMGVEFKYDTAITSIRTNRLQEVAGVESEGVLHKADNYVISPGAYAADLMSELGMENLIHSVFGAWLELPNDDQPLTKSLKVTRCGPLADGAAEGANVIVGERQDGRSTIHISSGHGYVGANPKNISCKQKHELFEASLNTANALFPDKFDMVREKYRTESADVSFCVRPWMSNCLGLFKTKRARNGVMVITGGHNTGGFAQAPSVASATSSMIAGRRHRMHYAYHPARTEIFNELIRLPREKESEQLNSLSHASQKTSAA